MGFRFRQSFKILPGVRLNLSGGGASVSLGARGFHYTIGSKGTRTTVGIPGTGLSWSNYTSYGQPRRTTYVPEPARPTSVIESNSIEQIAIGSSSELAPLLKKVRSRVPLWPFVVFVAFVSAIVSGATQNAEWSFLALYVSVLAPFALMLDRRRRSLRLSYILDHETSIRYELLHAAFSDLRNCSASWRVPSEQYTSDWKRNAGASTLISRKILFTKLGKPLCIRGSLNFPTMKLGRQTAYFAPDGIFLTEGFSITSLSYLDLKTSPSSTLFNETSSVPGDTQVVGHTWRYTNKSGGPDRRFNGNYQIPTCRYGRLDFQSDQGLNERILVSNVQITENLSRALEGMDVNFSSQIASLGRNGITSVERETGSTILVENDDRSSIRSLWLLVVAILIPAALIVGRHFYYFKHHEISSTMRPQAIQKLVVEPVKKLPQVMPALQSYVGEALTPPVSNSSPIQVNPPEPSARMPLDAPLPRPRPRNIGSRASGIKKPMPAIY